MTVMCCCGSAQAQIAPGPLSPAHAQLTGITKCASCHDFGARGLKCLECHVEIKRRVEAGTGFHSRAYKSAVGSMDCARCHVEHRGSKFSLIPLDRKSFNHAVQTGFTLEGKHREQPCEKCHNATKIAAAARAEIKLQDLNRSFLGLRRDCTACHQEPHQNQLGTDCLKCHSRDAWKPASGFNHSSASFQLTGLHLQVACAKCHARSDAVRGDEDRGKAEGGGDNRPQKPVLFKGLKFDGCQNCHTDPHHGAFLEVKLSGKCDGCHTTEGWKTNRPGKDFNHDSTKFRLAGKHAELSCAKCHKESDFHRPIAHERCQDCHEDQHKGQFAGRAAGSDCSACHSPSGFKPTLFDRDAHTKTAFTLLGKHASLRCAACHKPAGRDTRFKTGTLTCNSCHQEPHGGEFASDPHNNKCDQCHTEQGFETTTFTIERHAQTDFPLTGKHSAVECAKCHKPLPPGPPQPVPASEHVSYLAPAIAADGTALKKDARRQYHFASRSCNACHNDPHEFNAQANWTCETCHVTKQWNELRSFDHSRTRFKLSGSHLNGDGQPVGCVKCHPRAVQSGGVSTRAAPVFSNTSTECIACHREKDAHGGQFSGPGDLREDCSHCHTPAGWKIADFDHDRTRFALSVVHRKLECAQCHKEQTELNGRMVRRFRGTPSDCVKCH